MKRPLLNLLVALYITGCGTAPEAEKSPVAASEAHDQAPATPSAIHAQPEAPQPVALEAL